jgi:hypothetical protein
MQRRPRTTPHRTRTACFAVLLAILGTGIGAVRPLAPVARAGANDRLPDLRMAKLLDLRIQVTSTGRRLLRFSAMMQNGGAGAFELRSTRPNTATPWDINQVIFNDAAGSRQVDTVSKMSYGGDGHGHWHIERVVDSDLFSSVRTVHGSKIGFCFFDTNRWAPGLTGSPSSPVYRETDCARQSELTSRMGLSVGWGDLYQWSLPFQWIDITGVPGGDYYLRAIVDARDEYLESSDTNNCSYTRVRFSTTGTSVTELGSGSTCVNDWSSTSFAVDIEWLYAEGLTTGCGILLFCPAQPVTRGEMASFLVRAMELPPSATDAFGDDNGMTHEADINALAAAGITTGCAANAFCPNRGVSRAEMASFLVRALDLPLSAFDAFIDDDGTTHETNIDALAAAGITNGCAAAMYCPTRAVSRGEMAGFLHRSFA